MKNLFDTTKDLGNSSQNEQDSTFLKIFDWIKVAKIIKENQIQNTSVALGISLEKTYPILKNGKPIKNFVKIMESQNANPILINDDNGQLINCFSQVYEDENIKFKKSNASNLNEATKTMTTILQWPILAIDILTKPFYSKNIS